MRENEIFLPKTVAIVSIVLFLATSCTWAFPVLSIQATGNTIYIRADGTVDPPTAPIQQFGDFYVLTSNINESIIIERDDIVVEGSDHTVQGFGSVGVDLSRRTNVTVMNFEIKGFVNGIHLELSHNNTISDNTLSDLGIGIHMGRSNFNEISWNKVVDTGGWEGGIRLEYSNNNSVIGNIVTNNPIGISLLKSRYNTISGNTVKYNGLSVTLGGAGISLVTAPNNTVSDNTIVGNNIGLGLSGSGDSIVSDNVMWGNKYNFGVGGDIPVPVRSDFDVIIDKGNVVDGKPILYIVNQSDLIIDSTTQAATIYVIDSSNITIRDQVLANSKRGITFWNTSNARIENNEIVDCYFDAIALYYSHNITISGNLMTDCFWHGMYIARSNNVTVSGNTLSDITVCSIRLYAGSHNILSSNVIANAYYPSGAIKTKGIVLAGDTNVLSNNVITNLFEAGIIIAGSFNILSENTVSTNLIGIEVEASSADNRVFHNNFLKNTYHVSLDTDLSGVNEWDNGAEGNYWDNSTTVDADKNGISDTPYFVNLEQNVQDFYPLTDPWNHTRIFDIKWNGEHYRTVTRSGSTIANLIFNQTAKQISFKATGPSGTTGFCNVTIPKELLDAPLDQWTITVNGETVSPSSTEDATHTFVYCSFTHSTQTITIEGTNPIDKTKPVANAGPDQEVNEDTIITLNGSASTDDIDVANYTWTFVDQIPITLSGVSQNYTFRSTGTYSITLNVFDLRGNWDTDTITVTVLSIPVWSQWWFWTVIFFVSTTSVLSFLALRFRRLLVRFRRRGGTYERLWELVGKYRKGEIAKQIFEERLEEIRERSDVDIKEYLDAIMTLQRLFDLEKKMKKK